MGFVLRFEGKRHSGGLMWTILNPNHLLDAALTSGLHLSVVVLACVVWFSCYEAHVRSISQVLD